MAVKRMDNVGIVVADLEATIAFFRELGRLCYIRGPEGLLIGLAQELG
jgi:hypothetical protein